MRVDVIYLTMLITAISSVVLVLVNKLRMKKEREGRLEDRRERLDDGTLRVILRNGEVFRFEPRLDWLPRVQLNCGACVCLLNKYYSERLSFNGLNSDRETFREGDSLLLCNDGCPAFNVCTLAQRILGARSCSEIETLIHPLVAKGEFLEGEVGFPGIDNAKFAHPDRVTDLIRLKALVVSNNGHERVIVPPMLADLKDCGEGADAGGERPDGGNPGQGERDVVKG